MYPISVQMYSLREACKNDVLGVLKQLADVGYAGVEPFQNHGFTPRELRRQIESLGLRISSSHYPFANRVSPNETIEVLGELGQHRAAAGYGPEDFKDMDAIMRTAEKTNSLIEALKKHGISLFLHNHWWEYEMLDGRLKMHWLEDLCPQVQFEMDTYWASNFGAVDVPTQLKKFGKKTPLLHIKDGPLEQNKPHVAVGQGKCKIKEIIQAADPQVCEWAIVELDACATDMMTAVKESYQWLTSNGLAKGRGQ